MADLTLATFLMIANESVGISGNGVRKIAQQSEYLESYLYGNYSRLLRMNGSNHRHYYVVQDTQQI
ncbi:hypothetical protein D3C81_1487470 [compost metagenome]